MKKDEFVNLAKLKYAECLLFYTIMKKGEFEIYMKMLDDYFAFIADNYTEPVPEPLGKAEYMDRANQLISYATISFGHYDYPDKRCDLVDFIRANYREPSDVEARLKKAEGLLSDYYCEACGDGEGVDMAVLKAFLDNALEPTESVPEPEVQAERVGKARFIAMVERKHS